MTFREERDCNSNLLADQPVYKRKASASSLLTTDNLLKKLFFNFTLSLKHTMP